MRSIGLSWVLALTLSAPALAGGDEAGNGGGIAEQNFVLAYSQLAATVRLTLDSPANGLTEDERRLLDAIFASLPAESASGSQLRFKSERREPGFFIIDGSLKIARTGSQVGSAIYVNIDLLYRNSADGGLEPLGLETATAVLVHELGHHHGVSDHAALDRLGVKVGAVLSSRISRADLGPGRRHLRVTVIDLDRRDSMARLILSDGLSNTEISHAVWAVLRCPEGFLEGAALYSPRGRMNEGLLRVRADLSLFCSGRVREGYALEASIALAPDSLGVPRIRAGTEVVEQVSCGEPSAPCGRGRVR